MEIKFKKEELSAIIDKMSRIIRKCDYNSVYNRIRIDVQDKLARFRLRGGAFFLETKCKCSSTDKKSIIVNARSFLDIAGNLDAPVITLIEDDNGVITMEGGGISINIPLLVDTSFIEQCRPDKETISQIITLKKEDLCRGIANCIPFESKSDPIVGINFEQRHDALRLCCSTNTCGNLYYIKNIKIEKDAGINFTLDTFLAGCINLLFKEERELKLEIYNNQLYIETESTNLSLRFLNVTFPKVEMAIPKEFETVLPANKEEFKRVIDLAEILLQGEEVFIEYNNRDLVIKCGEVVFKTKTETKNNVRVKLNRNLLKKILNAVDKDSFEFLYNQFPKPLIINTERQVLLLAPQAIK